MSAGRALRRHDKAASFMRTRPGPAHADAQVEDMAEEARHYFAASEPARENKRVVLG